MGWLGQGEYIISIKVLTTVEVQECVFVRDGPVDRTALTSPIQSERALASAVERERALASPVQSERALASPVERERALAAGVQRVVVRVHEGQRLVTVGALLRVALVHRVDHHGHLLTGAVQCLLTLLGQFP